MNKVYALCKVKKGFNFFMDFSIWTMDQRDEDEGQIFLCIKSPGQRIELIGDGYGSADNYYNGSMLADTKDLEYLTLLTPFTINKNLLVYEGKPIDYYFTLRDSAKQGLN